MGVDINEEVIKNLNFGKSHINEPFVNEMLKNSIIQKKLTITNKPNFADAFFITVPTPIINLHRKKKSQILSLFILL